MTDIDIRKIVTLREVIYSELGRPAARLIVRAVGMAVIRNPFAGRRVADLRELFEAGAALGERIMPELIKLLDGPAVSYGKGALVGVDGEMEHGGACVHPMLGRPMRAAVGGGKAVIGSNVKVAAAGAILDVPLGHKDDSWSFEHFDTITVSLADAPRSAEILVVMAIADGGRLDNRCGGADPLSRKAQRFRTATGSDSVKGVGVVVEHHAAAKPPFAVFFCQFTFVAAGWKLSALAIAGNQYEQVAGGARPLALNLGGDVADHVTELRAILAQRGEAAGEGADRLASRDYPDRRAFEDGIGGEAADDRLDIAGVQRSRVTHKQIVDRQPVFDRRHWVIAWRKRCRLRLGSHRPARQWREGRR